MTRIVPVRIVSKTRNNTERWEAQGQRKLRRRHLHHYSNKKGNLWEQTKHTGHHACKSLAPTRQQLGSKSSSSASPCGVSSSFSCLSARSFHWFLPTCLLGVLKIMLTVCVLEQPFTMDTRPSEVGASAWFLSYALWICLHVVGVCLR